MLNFLSKAISKKFSTTPTPPTPKASNSITFISKIPNKQIIELEGSDHQQVLNNITTCDFNSFLKNPNQGLQHTAFQDIKGRIISDAIQIKPIFFKQSNLHVTQNDKIWLEVPTNLTDEILKHFKRHSFRKKISLNNITSHLNIFAIYNPFSLSEDLNSRGNLCKEFYSGLESLVPENSVSNDDEFLLDNYSHDPRYANLGCRIYANSQIESFSVSENDFFYKDSEFYDIVRYLNGIGEGEEQINKQPFNSNQDFMNSISQTKGCYMGQELSARTFYTGVVRKRLMPVIISKTKEKFLEIREEAKVNQKSDVQSFGQHFLDNDFEENLTSELLNYRIKNDKGKRVGQIVAIKKNIGLVVLDYLNHDFDEIMYDGQYYFMFTNGCWKDPLQNYKQSIQDRLE